MTQTQTVEQVLEPLSTEEQLVIQRHLVNFLLIAGMPKEFTDLVWQHNFREAQSALPVNLRTPFIDLTIAHALNLKPQPS